LYIIIKYFRDLWSRREAVWKYPKIQPLLNPYASINIEVIEPLTRRPTGQRMCLSERIEARLPLGSHETSPIYWGRKPGSGDTVLAKRREMISMGAKHCLGGWREKG
jgi:hypothetical protein